MRSRPSATCWSKTATMHWYAHSSCRWPRNGRSSRRRRWLAIGAAIVAAVTRDSENEAGFVALPDLSHPVRTGRVSRAQAAIGGLLKIVPVLRFGNGAVEVEGRVRTFARAQETLVESTLRVIGDVARSRILVIHAHALEGARALQAQLRGRLEAEPEFFEVAEAGPAIAAHSGQGALAIFSVAG